MAPHDTKLRVTRAKLTGATRRLNDIDLMNETGQRLTNPGQRQHVVNCITELDAEITALESNT